MLIFFLLTCSLFKIEAMFSLPFYCQSMFILIEVMFTSHLSLNYVSVQNLKLYVLV